MRWKIILYESLLLLVGLMVANGLGTECVTWDWHCNDWGCKMYKDDTDFSGGGTLFLKQGDLLYWTDINFPCLRIYQHCTGDNAWGIKLISDNENVDAGGILIDYRGDDGDALKIDYDGDNGHGIYIEYSGSHLGKHGICVMNFGYGNAGYFRNSAVNSAAIYAENSSTGNNGHAAYFYKDNGYSDVVYSTGNSMAIHGVNSSLNYAGVFGEQTGAGYGVYGKCTGSGVAICGYSYSTNSKAGHFENTDSGTK
jgi:hypothetical protein